MYQLTSPVGKTRYEYDSISGLLSKITSPQGKEFTFLYDRGELETMGLPNGTSARYTFNGAGNLEDLHYQKQDGSTVQHFMYSYDENGMRTSLTDNDGLHEYAYDPLYQIIQATHPTVYRPTENFQYDAVGNWLGSGRVHNAVNQITEDDSCRYFYDLDGNMTEKISKATGDTTYFVWDIENKLIEVRRPGMHARYTYDPFGRRMSKEVNGVVTQFRYDGQDLIIEMDENDSITASYTFGPGIDNPLAMNRNDANYYYVKDGLGSVTALNDSNANVVKEYWYSVFGEIIGESGDSALLNPFTFTSREYDDETGNYYYRARYYEPRLGRFFSEDPIGFNGGINFYRYVDNSPANFIDPSGLECTATGKKKDNLIWSGTKEIINPTSTT